MRYIKGLDTLRAVAIMLVIITHWGPHTLKSIWLTFFFSKILPNGMFGVDLFFVLSGYLITTILLTSRQENDETNRLIIIKNFYIRRILRIFPIYFLFVFIMVYLLNNSYIKDNILYFITYTTDFLVLRDGKQYISHTWSLAVEEQFYLLWPWVIIYTPKKYLFRIIILAIAVGLISTIVLQYFYGIYAVYLPLPCITAFAIGALYSYVNIYNPFKKVVITIFLILLPFCIALLLIYQFGNQFILIRSVNSVIAIVLVIYVSRENYNSFSRYVFNNKLLTNVGKISYGIYLYHFNLPFYYSAFINYLGVKFVFNTKTLKLLINPPPAYLIQLTLLLLISIASYHYIELVFLRLKKNFSYPGNKKPLPDQLGLVK
jgi:peptidoglycan/LPS O-acetylase OafA/YrhL